MRVHVAGLLIALSLGGGITACRDRKPAVPPTPGGPAETAVGLFRLAHEADPDPETLERLFGPQEDARRLAALYDSLTLLGQTTEPRSTSVERLDGLDRTLVDLTAVLPGGASAEYSVQLEPDGDGWWRITWFQGPGVEWPPRPAPRGEGLSTSPPPGRPGRG